MRHGVAVGVQDDAAATVGAGGLHDRAVVRDGGQGPKPGLFLGEALDGFAVSLAVKAHIGHGVHPLTPGRVEGAEGGDVPSRWKSFFFT